MMMNEPNTVSCVIRHAGAGVGVAGVVIPLVFRASLAAPTHEIAAAGALTCRVAAPVPQAPDGLSDHARGVRAERARVLLELRRRAKAARRLLKQGQMDGATAHDRRGQAETLADWLRHGLHWLADDQRAAAAAIKEETHED